VTPQPPQLRTSVCVLTQAPPQNDSPLLHAAAHTPAVHTAVPPAGAEHATPQLPQFLTSVFVLTQAPPQTTCPAVEHAS
jgi:hypothetical protein